MDNLVEIGFSSMDDEMSERLATLVKTAMDSGDIITAIGLLEFAKLQVWQFVSFANLKDPNTQKMFTKITDDILKKD